MFEPISVDFNKIDYRDCTRSMEDVINNMDWTKEEAELISKTKIKDYEIRTDRQSYVTLQPVEDDDGNDIDLSDIEKKITKAAVQMMEADEEDATYRAARYQRCKKHHVETDEQFFDFDYATDKPENTNGRHQITDNLTDDLWVKTDLHPQERVVAYYITK